jgi:hypothetical protein
MARGKMTKSRKAAEAASKKNESSTATEESTSPAIEKRTRKRAASGTPKNLVIKLGQLNEYKTKLDTLVEENEDYVISHRLIMTDGKVLPEKNKSLFAYEESLFALMISLDKLSFDHQVLRDARKRIIVEINTHLHKLDEYKADPNSCNLPIAPVRVKKAVKQNYGTAYYLAAIVLLFGLGAALIYMNQ